MDLKQLTNINYPSVWLTCKFVWGARSWCTQLTLVISVSQLVHLYNSFAQVIQESDLPYLDTPTEVSGENHGEKGDMVRKPPAEFPWNETLSATQLPDGFQSHSSRHVGVV